MDIVIVVVSAVVFGLAILLRPEVSADADGLRLIASAAIVGAFIGVIAITETVKAYRAKGSRIRMVSGCLVGLSIAGIYHAPLEGYLLGAIVGTGLGWLGMYWAEHVRVP